MIKDIVSVIREVHSYPCSSKTWARIGSMHNRYGGGVMEEAIRGLEPKEVPIIHFFNILEKRCQYVLENSEMDDLASELLGLD